MLPIFLTLYAKNFSAPGQMTKYGQPRNQFSAATKAVPNAVRGAIFNCFSNFQKCQLEITDDRV